MLAYNDQPQKQEVSMLRLLAIAIGLALCLLGSSSAYAGKATVMAWTYKNGKIILAKPIKFWRYERDEIDPRRAWAVFWPAAAGAAGGNLWNNRQK
jgi:hypothetical protein